MMNLDEIFSKLVQSPKSSCDFVDFLFDTPKVRSIFFNFNHLATAH